MSSSAIQFVSRYAVMAICMVASLVAGTMAFLVIFLGPAYLSGNEILLLWGWFGWIPAGGFGALVSVLVVRVSWGALKTANGLRALGFPLMLSLIIFLASWMLTLVGKVDANWREQVMLSSGDMITLQRRATGDAFGMKQPTAWKVERMHIQILDAHGQPAAVPLWESRTFPIYLDFDRGSQSWIIVSEIVDCGLMYELGKPRLPYLQHVARKGAGSWAETPVDAKYFGKEVNLLTIPRSSGEPELLTLQEKVARLANWHGKRHIEDRPSGC